MPMAVSPQQQGAATRSSNKEQQQGAACKACGNMSVIPTVSTAVVIDVSNMFGSVTQQSVQSSQRSPVKFDAVSWVAYLCYTSAGPTIQFSK